MLWEATRGNDLPGGAGSMAIVFACTCGKKMRADDALAGRMTNCVACGKVLQIPRPAEGYELAPDPLAAPAPNPSPGGRPLEPAPLVRPPPAPRSLSLDAGADLTTAGSGSIREYAYLLLLLTLVPLVFSLLGKDDSKPLEQRIEATLQTATPEELRRAESVLSKNEGVRGDELLAVMPEGKLLDAHLPYNSAMHWISGAT